MLLKRRRRRLGDKSRVIEKVRLCWETISKHLKRTVDDSSGQDIRFLLKLSSPLPFLSDLFTHFSIIRPFSDPKAQQIQSLKK